MQRSLNGWLVDPRDGGLLTLEEIDVDGTGEISSGALVAVDGTTFPIRQGIPDFVEADAGASQTAESFGWKWAGWDEAETQSGYDEYRSWFVERHFGDDSAMHRFMSGRRRILDVGCGSGLSSSIYLGGGFDGDIWIGADLSTAIAGARKRLRGTPRTHFVRADMLQLPFRAGAFDTLVAEGTLHHTPSTRDALAAVVRHLEPGGVILFYVYRLKSAVREFTDDLIRERISDLSPDDAMKLVTPLTELGRALAEVGRQIEVPDIPVLGIAGGTYDVQRFFYWHVAKVFWNDAYSFEENNHINFDWFHPKYAHRQTADEVRQWCDEIGLEIERWNEEDAGFSVRARLRA